MENRGRNSRKIILFTLLILLVGLIGIGGYSYFSFNTNKNTSITNINVSSGKMYPEYSPDIKEYQVYTDSDEVTINCDLLGENVEGCNKKVTVSEKVSDYEITTKEEGQDVKYVIKIVKQDTNYSELVKINKVEGVPDSWVKSTTIKVNVDTENEIEGITYSFDGGKTWGDSNSIEIKANTTLQILAKDYFGYVTKTENVIIDKIDNDKPSVALSKKSLDNGKVLLTATAVDDGSSVSGYNWNDKGYGSSNTLEVDKAGTYFVVVNDKVGNESEKVSIQVSEDNLKDPNEKEFVAVFDNNGANSISAETLKCTTKETSCVVKAPSITRENYNILGWSTNSNATKAEIQVGSDIELTGEKKYYAITSKSISATFNKNGADSIGSEHLSCNIYNNQTSCNIVAPNIKKSGYSIAGWSTKNNASAAEVKVGEKLVLSQNKVFYAITYDKVTISFNKNGSSKVGSNNLSCYRYNGQESCTITLPTITAASGFEVIGWANSASSITKTASVDQKVTVNKNANYYAITKSKVPYKVTFNKNGASNISYSSQECYRYNGSSSCIVTTPTITAQSGFSVVGWGSSASSITKVASVNQKISLNKNINYYAVTKSNDYYTVTFNKNGASSIGSSSLSCYRYNNQSSCSVTLPTITAASGFEVIGWANSASATSKVASIKQTVSLTGNTTYYAITKSQNPYKATFNKNGASSIGSSSQECYRYNGATSCIITTPTITAQSGFNVVGWGSSASAIAKSVSANQRVSLKKNVNFYAVTKSEESYKVTFNKNGAKSIGSSSLDCYRYNNQSSCTVTLPTITAASGFEVIGWGNSVSATSKVASAKETVSLNKNTTYYAVTKSKDYYKVTFWPRTGSIGDYSIGTGIVRACYRYNGQSTCSVTTPAVNISSKQQFLGWSTNTSATSSSIKSNQAISLKANDTYYAIIKETLTLTFNKNGASSITSTKATCTSYGDGCTITDTASINKPGYEIWGFSSSSNSGYGSVINKKITQNTTLYARVYNNYRKKAVSVATSYKINGIYIDVEKSSNLPYSVYNTYYNFIKKVSTKMPYLYDSKGKITMMSSSTFVNTWGTGWAGMAYGIGEYSSNDVSLSSTVSEYSKGSFVHEQGHNFDAYYGIKTGKTLSAQADILALYNKYKKQSSSTRPMRDYSYTNEREFVAEAIEYYYYYKYETVKCPNGGNQITSDIIKTFEKYFKIAKNGYK